MSDTVLGFGLVCIAAAIIGGGLTAAGTKIPLINSISRQVLLGVFGAAIAISGRWMEIRPVLFPPRLESLTDGPRTLVSGDERRGEAIDEMQSDVLRIIWNVQGGVLHFGQVAGLMGAHPNLVRIACQGLEQRGLIAYDAYNADSLVELLPEGRVFAARNHLTDLTEILKAASVRAQQAVDPDYAITVENSGEFRVTPLSDRAQGRITGRSVAGQSLVFKGRDPDLVEFVRVAEAAGFIISGKNLL